jgi:hypothetical protein
MLLHSDLRRAEFCRLSYDPARRPDWEVPGLVRGFLDEEPEGPVVTIEGTRANVLEDWMRDLDQIATTRILGLEQLPNGFADDILAIIFAIIADLHGQPLGWNGHSKGGSEALIGAVLWLLSGNKCRRITALEPARVGRLGGKLVGQDVLIIDNGSPIPYLPSWLDHPVPATTLTPPGEPSLAQRHEIGFIEASMLAALNAGQHFG